MRAPPLGAMIGGHGSKEVERNMQRSLNWKHLLYTAATLATLLLAAGARWKPSAGNGG